MGSVKLSSKNSGSKNLGGRKIRSLLLLLAGLSVLTAAAGALYLVSQPTTLRIAVGPGSDDQRLMQALAQALVHERSPVRLSLVDTAGPVESAALLGSSKADLAVARADNSEMPPDAASIAIMRKNIVVLWSPSGLPGKGSKKDPKPKIKKIDDFDGRRIGVVGRTDENIKLLHVILKESGVDPANVAVTQFGVDQIIDMTRDPKIDAFMMVGPIDSKQILDAIASTARYRGEPKFLPVDVSEAIAQRHPLYGSEEISGSSFSSSPARPDDTVETVSVNHLIVALKSLSETKVGALTRDLFAVRTAVARDVPAAIRIEKPDTDKDAALPAHPGAAAYIDGTERTFMEKYSDYIWISIFVLTAFGSAGAWLRYYLTREERAQNTEHRDKLLLTIAGVRRANSLEELAEMQDEADRILRETLVCYDDGAIEEGHLAAFSLVLDQFHHAVHDRRATLSGIAAELPRLRAS